MGPVTHSNLALGALAGMLLSACMDPVPQAVRLTLPPADGRSETVKAGPQRFDVNRQPQRLRVTRLDGRDLGYSEGAIAKRAAQAYCAAYGRDLDAAALGRFSAPNAWIFAGDCL
mgnify:CR=1 FL=1